MNQIVFSLVLALGALFLASSSLCAATPHLVPLPQKFTAGSEADWTLNASTQISYDSDLAKGPAGLLAASLRPATGYSLPLSKSKKARANTIHFALAPKGKKDAYGLKVTAQSVIVSAADLGGYIYGSQTLKQLLPAEIHASTHQSKVVWSIASCEIEDYPNYPWRGMMLDVSRYFLNKDYIKRYLDIMAMHKLNVLHWHLIDDCGWRIEIKKYPKLTEVGAWRGKGDQRRGGYYSQEDIREIVAYAAARNITVVPEIEIPAHTLSALAAYPHLGCLGKSFEMPTRHSISPEIYCVGKETTWTFLEDVMDEVVALFPSSFVHIGGDEARYARWNKCENCQARMKKEGLKTPQQLQGWATTRIEKILEKHDKQILGWAEILECGVSSRAGIMAWHKPHHAVEGAKNGNPVVSSLVRHTYFDTPESRLEGEPPCATWTAPVSLAKAYNWHPTPKELIGTPYEKNVLGGNGCIWTDQFLHKEAILADRPGEGTRRSERYVDYLSLPRMAALAEVNWTDQGKRDFTDFQRRMSSVYHRYLHAGYHFRMPTPALTLKADNGERWVVASSPIRGGRVRFTVDGSTPTENSPELNQAVTLRESEILKAVTFSADGQARSLATSLGEKKKDYSKFGQQIGEWKAGHVGDKKPKLVSFDATGKINANGEYIVTFLYTGGESRLDIDGIKVLRNDVDAVAEDRHHGFTGGQSKNNSYRIVVDNYQTGASFKVKALIYGDISSDSNGVVMIRKK